MSDPESARLTPPSPLEIYELPPAAPVLGRQEALVRTMIKILLDPQLPPDIRDEQLGMLQTGYAMSVREGHTEADMAPGYVEGRMLRAFAQSAASRRAIGG